MEIGIVAAALPVVLVSAVLLVVGTPSSGGPGALIESLLSVLLSEKLGVALQGGSEPKPEVLAIRESLTATLRPKP